MSEKRSNEAPRAISVVVNGQATLTSARSLSQLVAEQDQGESKIATAINGSFVPTKLRATTELAAGDRIEIVSARQGG